MALSPCVHCRRHVAVDARVCPFCGGAGVVGARVPRVGRSTRKAIAVFSLALVGCSGSDETSTGATDTGTVADTGSTGDTASTGDTGGTGDTSPGDTGPGDTGPGDTGPGDTGPGDTKADGDATADATDAVADGADTGPVDTGFFPPYGHPPWDEAFV